MIETKKFYLNYRNTSDSLFLRWYVILQCFNIFSAIDSKIVQVKTKTVYIQIKLLGKRNEILR